jgi:coenzyme F420-reducing hydrogenase gamma subunit
VSTRQHDDHGAEPVRRLRVAVWKFASCDGCQLQLLDAVGRRPALLGRIDFVQFLEASSRVEPGPYDVGIVEGSVSTPHDVARIREVRRQCRFLVTIGACATSGGIQALRNWGRVGDFLAAVYASPAYVDTLATSTGIAEHVPVDFELRGCPVDTGQLAEILEALVLGRKPRVPSTSVCAECKAAGIVCVAVTRGIPCLGPVTQAGCGALCPAHGRECFGCFGPAETTNLPALSAHYEASGTPRGRLLPLVRGICGWAPAFRAEGDRLAGPSGEPGP